MGKGTGQGELSHVTTAGALTRELTWFRVDESEGALEGCDNLLSPYLLPLLYFLLDFFVIFHCYSLSLVVGRRGASKIPLTEVLAEDGIIATLVIKVDGISYKTGTNYPSSR